MSHYLNNLPAKQKASSTSSKYVTLDVEQTLLWFSSYTLFPAPGFGEPVLTGGAAFGVERILNT